MIWCVEDDTGIREIEIYALKSAGFETRGFEDGLSFWEALKKEKPDLVILDIMLPGMDGVELLTKMKETAEYSNIPVIMATAKGQEYDRIHGLDIGADDYIVKPFSPSEVMARVRAVLRRIQKNNSDSSDNILSINSLIVNIDEYTLSISGNKVPLTKKEIETMWILAGNPNKVFTRDNLLDSLWGIDYYGDPRTVDSHIKRLRAKLDQFEHPDWRIKTIWGLGYKFELD